MEKLRIALAVAVLLAAGGVGTQVFGEEEEAGEADKCQCYFPNTNSYGRFDSGGHCVKQDCWVPLKLE